MNIDNEHPEVSVIIPTYNSEKTIEKCLKSIKKQSYQNVEVIIVDGGSLDNTINISRKYDTVIYEKLGSGMAEATNFGVKKSKGKYIYRVDSDVVLDSNIVEQAVEKCEKDNYSGVCIFWIPDETISYWAKIRKFLQEIYIKNPQYVGSIKYNKNILGARFLKKDVFLLVGGINENLPAAGEDYDLYNKLAKTDFIFAIIEAREKHIGEPIFIEEIVKKNFRYGVTSNQFSKNSEFGSSQMSLFKRNYLIDALIKAFETDIKIFFGIIIYGFLITCSSRFGLLYSVLTGKSDFK